MRRRNAMRMRRKPDGMPRRAMGRSGIREIRIRDFQIISDSKPDLAGYDLGPGADDLRRRLTRLLLD